MSTQAASVSLFARIGQFALPALFLIYVIAVPLAVGSVASIFRDGDVSWHVAAGNWILAHGRIPTTDPFSFTAAGKPWVEHEWLADILLAVAFKAADFAGLATMVALALVALHTVVFFYLQRRVSPVVLGCALLLMDLVIARLTLARPHVLAWPLLATWVAVLLTAYEQGRPPSLWWCLLLPLWANMHASFPLAVILAGALGLDTLIRTRWAALRKWVIFLAACLLALSLNANGLAGIVQPFAISSLKMLRYIGEWQPSTPSNSPLFFGIFLLGLGALIRSRLEVPIGRLSLLILMMGLALAHQRHQSALAIVSAIAIPTLWQSEPASPATSKWALAVALPLLAIRAFVPILPPETGALPRTMIAAIPPELRSQPVFNEYTYGGPLILAGIRPYIDGRSEMYGDPFVEDYEKIVHCDMIAFDRAVRRYDIKWTMLPVNDDCLINTLEASGNWHRVYTDKIGVIDVRNDIKPR